MGGGGGDREREREGRRKREEEKPKGTGKERKKQAQERCSQRIQRSRKIDKGKKNEAKRDETEAGSGGHDQVW